MSAAPLRVAFIDHCAQLSGAELALLRMVGALQGVDRYVWLAEDGPLVSRLEACGANVEVLPLAEAPRALSRHSVNGRTLAGPHAVRTAAYAIRLAGRLRQVRPDVVHTNSLKSALYGGAAAKLARLPLVVQLNDRIAPDYLPAAALRVVQNVLQWMPDAIVANSETTLGTLDPPSPRRSGPSRFVVYPPVPPIPATEERRGRTLRIGMVGRVGPTKGQHIFLQALARAFPEPEPNGGRAWDAVVIGAPLFGKEEEHYASGLPEIAKRAGLGDHVKFLGFRDDIAGELSQMDIMVHASVNPEPFGLAVVEAMAAGLPVIAAAPGGPAEVIEHGVTGLLYQAGDVAGLAHALRRLAADPALRAEMGRAAKIKSAEYAPSINAANTLKVYQAVLESGARRARTFSSDCFTLTTTPNLV